MTASVVDAFNAAFNSRDVDAVMAWVTDDCVFESTGPAPDGARYEGAAAVRKRWEQLFAETGDLRFTTEELIMCGDRAVVRWLFEWTGGHVRGVDVIRIRDGKIAERLSYVKG